MTLKSQLLASSSSLRYTFGSASNAIVAAPIPADMGVPIAGEVRPSGKVTFRDGDQSRIVALGVRKQSRKAT
ncbi:hypothetical protein [Nitrospira sp. Nam74]